MYSKVGRHLNEQFRIMFFKNSRLDSQQLDKMSVLPSFVKPVLEAKQSGHRQEDASEHKQQLKTQERFIFKIESLMKDKTRPYGMFSLQKSVEQSDKVEPWARSKSNPNRPKQLHARAPPPGVYNPKVHSRVKGSVSYDKSLHKHQPRVKRQLTSQESEGLREGTTVVETLQTSRLENSMPQIHVNEFSSQGDAAGQPEEPEKNSLRFEEKPAVKRSTHKMYRDSPFGHVVFDKKPFRKTLKNLSFDLEGKQFELLDDSIVRYGQVTQLLADCARVLQEHREEAAVSRHRQAEDRHRLLRLEAQAALRQTHDGHLHRQDGRQRRTVSGGCRKLRKGHRQAHAFDAGQRDADHCRLQERSAPELSRRAAEDLPQDRRSLLQENERRQQTRRSDDSRDLRRHRGGRLSGEQS